MSYAWFVLAGVLLLLAGTLVALILRNRRAKRRADMERAEQQAELARTHADIRKLLREASTGNPDKLRSLRMLLDALPFVGYACVMLHKPSWEANALALLGQEAAIEIGAALHKGERTIEFQERLAVVKPVYEQFVAVDRSDEEAYETALVNLIEHLNGSLQTQRIGEALGYTITQVQDELSALLQRRLASLIERAAEGDHEAYNRAEQLINSTWPLRKIKGLTDGTQAWDVALNDRTYSGLGAQQLTPPPGWHDLVVQHNERPRFWQFFVEPSSVELLDAQHMAADAAETEDATQAHFVVALAMYDARDLRLRQLIGDSLWSDLLAVIAEARHDKGVPSADERDGEDDAAGA